MELRWLFALAVFTTLTGLGCQTANAAVELRDGPVKVTVSTLADKVQFCIHSDAGWKVSSDYGVEFSIPPQSAARWRDKFPKWETLGAGYYKLPVQFELKSHESKQVVGEKVGLALGACMEPDVCLPIHFEVTVPSIEDANISLNCGP